MLFTDDINENEVSLVMDSVLGHGLTLRELHGIPDDTMEHIYAHAYKFYTEGRLDEAEKFFSFLCMYDLKNADYFIGLGAVHQIKKNYRKACDFYALAHVLGASDFTPVFYSGQCQLLMGNAVKSLQCFDIVRSQSKDENLVKKANIYFNSIRSEQDEHV